MAKTGDPANPKSSMQVTSLSRCLIWTAVAVLGYSCQAQVMQAPGTMPGRQFPVPAGPQNRGLPAGMPGSQPATAGQPTQPAIHTGATATAPVMAPNLPPSLLDKPAAPAHVTLSDGSLSVDANNSSLDAILKDLETSSGMTVSGFGKDSRIFGVYGPGTPRDVLSSLLDGAGYNFLMVGSTGAGTPREIVLTARSNAPISAPSPGSSPQPDEEDQTPNNYPPMEVTPPPPVPQQMAPTPDQRPRTPQEMLLELQRLRQQQMQQQQGQPQPQ